MDELLKAKERYDELLSRIDDDMKRAEEYKNDMVARYKANMPLEAAITIQSQVLRIQDYITQKFNNKVELMRNYDDLLTAIEEAE